MIRPPGFDGRAPGGPSRWSRRSAEWHPLAPKLVVEVEYDQFSGQRFRHGTRFFPAELCGNTRQIALWENNIFRLGPAGSNPENPITDFPCVDCFSHRLHFAGKLKPGNVLRITRRRWIMAAALQDIGPVQSRRVNPHADTIRGWRGRSRNFLHTDSFHSAMRCDDYRAHIPLYSTVRQG